MGWRGLYIRLIWVMRLNAILKWSHCCHTTMRNIFWRCEWLSEVLLGGTTLDGRRWDRPNIERLEFRFSVELIRVQIGKYPFLYGSASSRVLYSWFLWCDMTLATCERPAHLQLRCVNRLNRNHRHRPCRALQLALVIDRIALAIVAVTNADRRNDFASMLLVLHLLPI